MRLEVTDGANAIGLQGNRLSSESRTLRGLVLISFGRRGYSQVGGHGAQVVWYVGNGDA